MPPVSLPSEDRPKSSAFTVLNNAESDPKQAEETIFTTDYTVPVGKNVNVVKPLQRIEDEEGKNHLNSAAKEEMIERMVAPAGPQTILDPKFSRALDFKLRRLKEKEILQANLRRPTRQRPRNGLLAASNPNISGKEQSSPGKTMSQSHPRIDIIVPENEKSSKVSPKLDKSPSPGRKSRIHKISSPSDGTEKPRFITTVKTGQFLLPPPEVATLLGLETLYPPAERQKIVYSYSSKPKAVTTRHKRCVGGEKLPNVYQTNTQPMGQRKPNPVNVFSGVRALVAGVVGMRHMMEQNHQNNKYV